MKLSEIVSSSQQEVNVLYAEAERVRAGAKCGPVIRSVYIIECCTKGKGSVVINGTEFPFGAGKCYVLLPGDAVKYTSDLEDPREGVWCALDGLTVGMCLKQAGITSEAPFLPPALFDAIRSCLNKLVQNWLCHDAGSQLRQTACAYELLGILLESRPMIEKSTLIDKAIGFMQMNYPEALNVDIIARQIGLERTYFSALFKDKTGVSPHQYLTQVRIQKACKLLDTTGYSISEVSYLVGLGPHNFSRLFKKEIGMTPQEYQRQSKRSPRLLNARTTQLE